MYACNVLAVSGALIAAVAAVPMAGEHHHQHAHHHARDIVWETATDEVVVTIPVTKTVWIEPGETPPTEPQTYAAPSSTAEAEPAAYSPSAAAPAPVYTPETSSSVYVAPPAYTPESSTSIYVAPVPTTTSVYVAPTPESTYVAPTTSTSVYVAPSSTYVAPAASTSASSYSGGSGLTYGMGTAGTSYTGQLTYFTPGMGACGQTSTEADHMVAISEAIFDSYGTANPNLNPLCGQTINIKGNDGSTYPATIWDRCPGCAEADLDLPEAFFDMVTRKTANGAPADGRAYGMEWSFA